MSNNEFRSNLFDLYLKNSVIVEPDMNSKDGSLVADEEQYAGSEVNIRQGVLENVAAALDPAFPELAEQTQEHRSIFQLARDGDVNGMETLFQRWGREPKCERVLKKINTLDENKNGILHHAARYEQLPMVKLIVHWGGDVNIRGEDGLTPLHFAAKFKIFAKVANTFLPHKYQTKILDATKQEPNGMPTIDIKGILDGANAAYEPPDTQWDGTNSGSVILYLAKQGADVNAKDRYGLTPLHYSAMRGNDDAATDLLQIPSTNLEAQDQQKLTPLHLACSYGQTEIVKVLLEHGANIKGFGEQHQTTLHKAAAVGNFDVIQLLISSALHLYGESEVKKLLQMVDLDHNTPLSLAVEGGSAPITKHLLDYGSDVNHFNKSRVYPLHSACINGSLEIVKILVKNSATINCLDSLHQTPLAVAAAYNHVKVIEFLLKRSAQIETQDKNGYTPLLLAASEGNAEAVHVLLQSGANIFCMDKEDRTVLYWASMQNHKNVVDVLLNDSRAIKLLKACNRFDNSPLHIACERGYLDIALTLMKAGADVDNKNEDERTPMHLAAKEGQVKICKELLKKDTFAVHDEDSESNTALHLACVYGHSRLVSTLISYGADIKSRNYVLWTPLDCAAAYGQQKCAKILLDANADINPMDRNKVTPLHLAAKYGHEQTVKLLIERGASVTQANSSGHNPLVSAIIHGQKDAAEVFIESDKWLDAMKCEFKNPATGIRDTPLRMLIKSFPDLASKVFDKCMQTNLQGTQDTDTKDGNVVSADDERLQIEFNYELLDDSYTIFDKKSHKGHYNNLFFLDNILPDNNKDYKSIKWNEMNLYDETTDRLIPEAEPYDESSTLMKYNHPLMICVKEKRVNLLGHPLCMALGSYKWNSYGRYIYYFTLLLMLLFVIFLSDFLVTSVAPYSAKQILDACKKYGFRNDTDMINETMLNERLGHRNDTSGPKESCEVVLEYCLVKRSDMATLSKYIIISLAGIQLLKEIFQITQKGLSRSNFTWARLTYFGAENVIEWICYVTAILFVYDFTACQDETGMRLNWQWQVGAISVTMSWLNLLSNVRKLPFLGIYVVMFTDVLQTFSRFAIICGLFLVAFALGFHALFAEQETMETVSLAMVKTFVMFIGELEYDNIFFDNVNPFSGIHYGERLPYPTFSLFFLLAFVCIMPLIIMNLLVGLAVDDIKTVQDNAVLSRLAMQVTLNLDVERMLPDFIRRRFIVKKQTLYPNVRRSCFSGLLRAGDDDISEIAKGVLADVHNQSEISQLGIRLSAVLGKMKEFKDHLKQVSQDLEGTKSLLQAVAKKVEVTEAEDGTEIMTKE